MIRVAATADIHSPQYLEDFRRGLARAGPCDILLLAGDLVLKNDYTQIPNVILAARESYGGEIIACFGNEEYQRDAERYMSFTGIRWVDDSAIVVELKGYRIGIVGSRGSLDRPTFWQRTHLKGIGETYRRRPALLSRLLNQLHTDLKIVLTHYSPTYLTLEGERERAWPEMACRRMEEVIGERQPDLWIHGHVHRGKRPEVEIGRTLVLNASLPARGGIVTIDLPRRTGLEKFF